MAHLCSKRCNLPLIERIKDGRIFAVSRRTQKGYIYLRCQTKYCRGTAKKLGNGRIVLSRDHSAICYADNMCQLRAEFLSALKTALKRNYWKLKVLYDTVSTMYPPEIPQQLPYNSILTTLKYWRRTMYPRNPESLDEMATQLLQPENSRLLEYDAGRLICRRIIDSLGKVHILLYDPQFVESIFRSVLRLFIDGTFQTTPALQDVYQLVTILGVTYDHAVPFAHILMASKSEAAYMAVFNEVANLINSAGVQIVMADFEQALRNACKAVFPNAHVTGCNVHYDRALLKTINKLKLNVFIRENEAAKIFIKKLMALAYLPVDSILSEYSNLKTTLAPALKTTLHRFLTYYERQWLRIVKPDGFSVWGMSRRTNNVTESYNSVLADEMGTHPSGWTFLVKLLKLTSKARNDVVSLMNNKRIKRHPRYATIYKRNELIKAWKQLYSDAITNAEFLVKAACLEGHIRQRLQVIANNPEEDELEMQEITDIIPAGDDPDFDHDIFEGLRFDDAHNDDEPLESDNPESDMRDSNHSAAESDTGKENSQDASAGESDAVVNGPSYEDGANSDSVHDQDAVFGANEGREAGTGGGVRLDCQAEREREAMRAFEVVRTHETRRDRQAEREREAARELAAVRNSEARRDRQARNERDVARELEGTSEHEATRESEATREHVADREPEAPQRLRATRELEAALGLGAARELEAALGLEAARELEAARQPTAMREIEVHRERVVDGEAVPMIIDITEDSNSGDVREIIDENEFDADDNDVEEVEAHDGPNIDTVAEADNEARRRARSKKKNLRRKRSQQKKKARADVIPRCRPHRRGRGGKERIQAQDCVICRTAKITHSFVPCGHNCVCATCVGVILSPGQKKWCPKCRGPFTQVIRIFNEH